MNVVIFHQFDYLKCLLKPCSSSEATIEQHFRRAETVVGYFQF